MDSKYVWFVFVFSLINLSIFVGTLVNLENMGHVDTGDSDFGVKVDSKWSVVSNTTQEDVSTVKYNDNENNVLFIQHFTKNKDS